MIALLLAGALEFQGFLWEPWPEAPVCERVTWIQVSWVEVHNRCGASACAVLEPPCSVISGYSETEARRMPIGVAVGSFQPGLTETLYDHESRHILDRLRHPFSGSQELPGRPGR